MERANEQGASNDAAREAAGRRYLALVEELHAVSGEPMTLEAIQREVNEIRRERRAARVKNPA